MESLLWIRHSCSQEKTRQNSLLWSLHPGRDSRTLLRETAEFFSFFFFSFFAFCFLGPHSRHMEVPRLGVESELQPPAYTTATTRPDLSCVWDLHHSWGEHWILHPLTKIRDRTHILVDTSQVHFCWAMMGSPTVISFKGKIMQCVTWEGSFNGETGNPWVLLIFYFPNIWLYPFLLAPMLQSHV